MSGAQRCVKDFSFCRAIVEAVESRVLLSGSPLTSIPALNSFPTAPTTLYLDFHGEGPQNWGMAAVPATPAYDIDGDPTTFSPQETANITQIWSRVAEAYSPFNVNVTTVDPGNWNLTGAGSNNNCFRVVIGGSGSWTGFVQGGTASIGSYYTAGLPNTAYVFPTQLGGDPQFIGETKLQLTKPGMVLACNIRVSTAAPSLPMRIIRGIPQRRPLWATLCAPE